MALVFSRWAPRTGVLLKILSRMESCKFMAEDIGHIQDSGLFSLTLILRFIDRALDVQQIRACCAPGPLGVSEMVKAANKLGFKASTSRPKWRQLSKAPLPGIVALHS